MDMKIIISPSIMCSTPSNMEAYIREFEKCGIDTIHFDVMDGHFVPNVMLGVRDYQAIKRMTDLPVDIHMMTTAPDVFIDYFNPQPGDWVSFHPETIHHPHRLLQKIRSLGCKAGIALSPGTSVEYVQNLADVLDFVLVMAVNPGFAGQKMVDGHLDKLRRICDIIAATGKRIDVIIDGNTTVANSKLMIEAGATGLVTGTSSMLKEGPEAFERCFNAYIQALTEA
jgi:ribulose-phosphate 3-epimerase